MANESVLKLTKEQKWAPVKKLVLSWQFLICIAAIFSRPLWHIPLAYFFLNTFQFDSNGIFTKSFVVLVGMASLWLMFSFFPLVIRRGKQLRELRKSAEIGDEKAKQSYFDVRNSISVMWRHFAGLAGLQLVIPAITALVLWGSIRQGEFIVRDHGKPRLSTRSESLKAYLIALKDHGALRPGSK